MKEVCFAFLNNIGRQEFYKFKKITAQGLTLLADEVEIIRGRICFQRFNVESVSIIDLSFHFSCPLFGLSLLRTITPILITFH